MTTAETTFDEWALTLLRKRKRIYLEDSRYYVEDVRKHVIETYGFDKVYKQGFNIKTPLDLELQTLATQH